MTQQFSCQLCDFKTSTEVLLKEHIEDEHEPECKFCEKQFQTSELLEKHTCKLNINNAEFKEFYMKNWILTHGCSAVFSKHLQKEIANLHIDKCWKHICPRRELPAWHSLGEILDDENGILHAGRKDFYRERSGSLVSFVQRNVKVILIYRYTKKPIIPINAL